MATSSTSSTSVESPLGYKYILEAGKKSPKVVGTTGELHYFGDNDKGKTYYTAKAKFLDITNSNQLRKEFKVSLRPCFDKEVTVNKLMLISFFEDADKKRDGKNAEQNLAAALWREESINIAANSKEPAKVLLQADFLRQLGEMAWTSKFYRVYQDNLETLKIDLTDPDYHRMVQECIMHTIRSGKKETISKQLLIFKINQLIPTISNHGDSSILFRSDDEVLKPYLVQVRLYCSTSGGSRNDRIAKLESIKQEILATDSNLFS